MKLLHNGDSTVDLSSANTFVALPLDGTTTYIENSLTRPRRIKVVVRFKTVLTSGNTITFQIWLGHGSGSTELKRFYFADDTVTVGSTLHERQIAWASPEIILTADQAVPAPGDLIYMALKAASDHSGGADGNDEEVEVYVFDLDDVEAIGGQDVTLVNNNLSVNVAEVGGNTPMVITDILNDGETPLAVDANGRVEISGTNNNALDDIADANGRVDLSSIAGSSTLVTQLEKAIKSIINKSDYNKSTGVMTVYDDDGTTPILTLTLSEADSTETRTPS